MIQFQGLLFCKLEANFASLVKCADNKASFYPSSPISLIKNMFDETRVVAQVIPYGENSITATFNIAGLEDKVSKIRSACNW